jgi:hypothetical protein
MAIQSGRHRPVPDGGYIFREEVDTKPSFDTLSYFVKIVK